VTVYIEAEYTADETLPSDVTGADLVSSAVYSAAKKNGLSAALSVPIPDITIAGFTVDARRLSAAARQLSDTVSVTTRFQIQVNGERVAEDLSAIIVGSADDIRDHTNSAMAASDWSNEATITAAPTMATPGVAALVVVVVPVAAPDVGQTGAEPKTASAAIAASLLAALVAITCVSFGGWWAVRSRTRKTWCSPKGGWWAAHSRSLEVSCSNVPVAEPCLDAAQVAGTREFRAAPPDAPVDTQARLAREATLTGEEISWSVDEADTPPACPRCPEPMTWSWYNQGPYRNGWHCEYFARCGASGANRGAHRWHCSACLVDICDKCNSDLSRRPTWRTPEAAAPRQRSTDIEVLSAAALHRLRQNPADRAEDEGRGRVQSILAPSVAARHRPRQRPTGRAGDDEHGQVQSILAPIYPARHCLEQMASDLGEGEERGQVQPILARSVAARHCSRQESGGPGEDRDHGQVQPILAPPIPAPTSRSCQLMSTSPPTPAAWRNSRREDVVLPPSSRSTVEPVPLGVTSSSSRSRSSRSSLGVTSL